MKDDKESMFFFLGAVRDFDKDFVGKAKQIVVKNKANVQAPGGGA
jgi:hypothetical protein